MPGERFVTSFPLLYSVIEASVVFGDAAGQGFSVCVWYVCTLMSTLTRCGCTSTVVTTWSSVHVSVSVHIHYRYT